MKKTLFLTAILGAALCSTAFGTTADITVNGQQYTAAVLTDDTATKPADETNVYLFNYNASLRPNLNAWAEDLDSSATIIASATDTSSATSYTAHKLFFDTNNAGDNIISANIIAGGSNSDDIRFWADPSKAYHNVLKGDINIGPTGRLQVWNENGINYIEGAINAANREFRIVGTAGAARLRLSGGATIGTFSTADQGGSHVVLSKTNYDGSDAKSLTYNFGTLYGTGTPSLEVEEGVTLNIGTYNSNSNVTNAGIINITNGGTLKKQIANTGTLNLAGDITLSGFTATTSEVLYGETAETTGANINGYLIGGTKTYQITSGTGGTVSSTATFTDGTLSGSDCTDDGLVTVSKIGEAAGMYYVNTGSLNYTADSVAASAATTGITVNTAATITMGEGTTLNHSNMTMNAMTTVTGPGNYVITTSGEKGNAEALLGNNLKFSGSDTLVTITGATFKGIDLSSGSSKFGGVTLEMKGIQGGYIKGWDGAVTMDRNVKLTDNGGDAAWKWTDGSSTEKKTMTFSGAWTGTGTFLKSTTDKQECFKFTGDLSGWTGTFKAQSGAVTDVTFSGSATDIALGRIVNENSGLMTVIIDNANAVTVAANIQKSGSGNVNIDVKADTTFNGTINASAMTVGTSKTATINKNSTLASLSGNKVVANADLTVLSDNVALQGLTLAGNKTITVNDHEGTLKTGIFTVTGSGATVNANLDLTNSIVMLNGNSVTLGCDVKLSGTNITLSSADMLTLFGDATTEAVGELELFTSADSVTLASGTTTSSFIMKASEAGITVSYPAGDEFVTDRLFLKYTGADGTGIVSLTTVPEPATATLSLLALAALASRRRRH